MFVRFSRPIKPWKELEPKLSKSALMGFKSQPSSKPVDEFSLTAHLSLM